MTYFNVSLTWLPAEAGIKNENKLRRDKTQHEFWESFPDETEAGTFLLGDVVASERIPRIFATPNPVTKPRRLPSSRITATTANKRNTTPMSSSAAGWKVRVLKFRKLN